MRKVPEEILVEYQKAQDSAEHYNVMIWTAVSVLLAFSTFILYQIFSNNRSYIFNAFLLIFGIFALFYFNVLIESANEIKNHKYNICKNIEKKFNFLGQNLGINDLPYHKRSNGMKILRAGIFCLYLTYFLAASLIISHKTLESYCNAAFFATYILAFCVILIVVIGIISLCIQVRNSNLPKK